MKTKIILFILLLSGISANAFAQEIVVNETPEMVTPQYVEPEYVGEVIMFKDGQLVGLLEKQAAQVKTKAGAGLYIVGIGKARSRITLTGTASPFRFNKSDNVQFVARAVDNNTDPMSIVRIFKFEVTKKERRAEVSSISTFGGSSDNNLELVPYTAKKIGVNSYLITLSAIDNGEYGIYITNPNSLDEKAMIISCFGVD